MRTKDPNSQKEQIVQIILSVVGNKYDPSVSVSLSEPEISQVKKLVLEGILSGKIPYSKRDNRIPAVYVTTIVREWLRKDKRLNGNKKHKPKPDPQTIYEPFALENFSEDQSLQSLLKLRKAYYDIARRKHPWDKPKKLNSNAIVQIDKQIKLHIQKLVCQKYSINLNVLPEELLRALDLIKDDQAA